MRSKILTVGLLCAAGARILFFASVILSASKVHAQDTASAVLASPASAVLIGTSPPLRSFHGRAPISGRGPQWVVPHRHKPFKLSAEIRSNGHHGKPTPTSTPTSTPTPTPGVMPTPSRSFDGGSDADDALYNGTYMTPPDTSGAVGTTDSSGKGYYVQLTNVLINVYDKTTGSSLMTQSLASLFGFGNVCSDYAMGDPVVLYDSQADRWLVSQIASSGFNLFGTPTAPFYECVAISTSRDPTGSYYLYALQTPNNYLNDYPKFGIWPDGYYETADLWSGPNFNTYDGVEFLAWERAAMLSGSSKVRVFVANVASPAYRVLPSDFDGTPPPAGEPNHLVELMAPELGDAADALNIWDYSVNWSAGTASLTQHQSPLPVNSFNAVLCSRGGKPSTYCIPQPGTSQLLDDLSDGLMFRLQYRYLGTCTGSGNDCEALVATHTILGPTGQAAIRYYDVRNSSANGAFTVYDQGTFAPDSNYRWMGSAAMDHVGNLVVGYSVSSSNLYPSIRYAGRSYNATGGLNLSEATLMAGSGSQTSSYDRWGDYSALALDPGTDCGFWYTNEYFPATSDWGWNTRVGSFSLSSCP